tara:strand:- start:5586 stop:5990 length:405 start_codon:yes stop_codon:yes gene_type:complete
MSKRFKEWKNPIIKDGELTKWNWMVQGAENLELGKNTDIGAFTYLNASSGMTICEDVQIGSHCAIYTVSTIDEKEGPVFIGKNARIGSHTTIMPGVTIGENAVVGAHSFVNKNVPDNKVAFGVPAKIIEKKDNE